MSVRLFFGYFLALAACTIIAFGAAGTGSAPHADAAEQAQPSASSLHSHKFALKHAQFARAD